MAHSESQIASANRRWSLSTPSSPLGRPHGQAVVGFSPVGSKLVPYNNNPGSLIPGANPPSARSYACRKVRHDISDEEKQEILMAFELFDSRKSGKLNSRELKLFKAKDSGELKCGKLKVAMRALEFNIKKEDARKLIQEYTKGRADEIDQDEFMEILTKKYMAKDPDEDLAKAFKFFDEDNTGKISLKNLRKIAKDLGEHITDDELAAMIDEFDKDGDGEINESEFFGIMKRDDLDL